MWLTVDSNDPLAEVLAVVGSMYGVTLQVAENVPAPQPASPRSRRTAAAATVGAPRASARAKRGTGVDSASVRAWARETGREVSDRGRLSSGLIAAYREAHG